MMKVMKTRTMIKTNRRRSKSHSNLLQLHKLKTLSLLMKKLCRGNTISTCSLCQLMNTSFTSHSNKLRTAKCLTYLSQFSTKL